jgi:RNA polymerase sigma factor (sigma-70 family)
MALEVMSSQLAPALALPVPKPSAPLRLLSDERLLEHVRNGSERAFDVLYHRHHRSVLAFCRHMLGSHHEAEDAVQHTFLAAYRGLMRSDTPIALRPWLYAIAHNRCISMLRARRERPVDAVPERLTEHLATEVERREDLRSLLTDIAQLPDDQRAALLLTELDGVSHAEIGRILGCRRERVKALVFQARRSLLDDRVARHAPCDEIRKELGCLSAAAALRRSVLRRHLRECASCRDFHEAVRRQRRFLAVAVPIAPGLVIKQAALGAATAFVGGGSGATSLMSGTLGGLVAQALVAVALTGAGTAAVTATGGGAGPGDGARAAPALVGRPPLARPVSHSAAPTPGTRRSPAAGAPSVPASRAGTREPEPVRSQPSQVRVGPDAAAPPHVPPRVDATAPATAPAAPTGAPGPGNERVPPATARGRRPTPPGHGRPERAEGPQPRGHRPSSPGRDLPARVRGATGKAPTAGLRSSPRAGSRDPGEPPPGQARHAPAPAAAPSSPPTRPDAPAGRQRLVPSPADDAAQLMPPAATRRSTRAPSATR